MAATEDGRVWRSAELLRGRRKGSELEREQGSNYHDLILIQDNLSRTPAALLLTLGGCQAEY